MDDIVFCFGFFLERESFVKREGGEAKERGKIGGFCFEIGKVNKLLFELQKKRQGRGGER